MKVQKLTPKKGYFPDVLRQLAQVPSQLYVLGANLEELLAKPSVSIVGSRKVSPYGRNITLELASSLARQQVVIISGLAIGVDGLAHKAAVELGMPTIAVLPCGMDRIYPATHYNLAKQILKTGGALVSEYNEGQDVRKENFIARNRLIAALCHGLLITEAAKKSGSLHTANFALEQGKEVMVVPGNITSSLSEGTNNLIKSGATVVTNYIDVLRALNIEESTTEQAELFGTNVEETILLKYLAEGVADSEELLDKSRLDADVFNQTLTMLEITGKIKSLGNNQWTL